MPKPADSQARGLSREENRRKAMAAVQGIFDRYIPRPLGPPPPPQLTTTPPTSYRLIQARSGPAFDNDTMTRAEILDASIGPPYDVPSSRAPAPSGKDGPPPPPPPNAGVVSSCTSRLLIRPEEGNYNGVLHGGAAGVIFDMLTTIALGPVARPGFWT